jgi:hypothetical protein
MQTRPSATEIIKSLTPTADKIRALAHADYDRTEISKVLGIRYQGGRRDALAIHPQIAQRIRAYLDFAGHATDLDGAMFRPLSHNR